MIQAKPDLPEAHLALGVALGDTSRLHEAIEEFRAVLRLRPGDAVARRNLEVAQELLRR